MALLKRPRLSQYQNATGGMGGFMFEFEQGESAQMLRRNRRHLGWLAAILSVGAVLVGAGIFWVAQTRLQERATDYVYFEMRVVDREGHPISGASLTHANKRIGVTDSFGEWRRFLRVKTGVPYEITAHKRHRGEELEVTRRFPIPNDRHPEEKSLEIVGRMRLSPKAEVAGEGGEVGHLQMRPPSVQMGMNEDGVGRSSPNNLRAAASAATAIEIAGHAPADSVTAASVSVPANAGSAATWEYEVSSLSGWARDDRVRAGYVRTSMLPALMQIAKTMKPPVTAKSWQVSVRHLPMSGDNGLLLVQSRGDHPQLNFSMLRNYLPGPMRTAEAVVRAVREQASKDARKSPPVPGWKPFELAMVGPAMPAGAKIFASGYEVTAKGSNRYQYWGTAGGQSNITVVVDGRVVLRERVTNSMGRPAGIAIGTLQVATRRP